MKGAACGLLVLLAVQLTFAEAAVKHAPPQAEAKVAGSAATQVHLAAAGSGAVAVAVSGLPAAGGKGDTTLNLTITDSTGDSFCFPKYITADVQKPLDICDEGFSINITGLGTTVCVKQVYKPVSSCFKSTECPEGTKSDESQKLCMPPKVRGTLVGMLTVFKVRATLPFKIVPALKSAFAEAPTSPIKPWQDLPKVNVNGLMKQTAAVVDAGKEVTEALKDKDKNIISIMLSSMGNINMTEFMEVTPQIDAWVSQKLEGLTDINEVTAEVSSKFPDCLYKCCKDGVALDTTMALASKACPDGMKLNSILDVCVSSAGYATCPEGMTQSDGPLGQPICSAAGSEAVLDSSKLATLIKSALHKHQCP